MLLKMRTTKTTTFRSGLERANAERLDKLGVRYEYETDKIKYIRPATYTPDFRLPNGIYVETKGRFLTEDRSKHLLVRAQNPGIEVRFVFSDANQKIGKGSKTTYAQWCELKGFKWADKRIPEEWCREGGVNPTTS